jgi:hypothetical protein
LEEVTDRLVTSREGDSRLRQTSVAEEQPQQHRFVDRQPRRPKRWDRRRLGNPMLGRQVLGLDAPPVSQDRVCLGDLDAGPVAKCDLHGGPLTKGHPVDYRDAFDTTSAKADGVLAPFRDELADRDHPAGVRVVDPDVAR